MEDTKREEEELRKKRKQQEEIKVPEGPMISCVPRSPSSPRIANYTSHSLYQIISNIKWDYESPHVAGCTPCPHPSVSLPDPVVADIDIVQPESKAVIDCKTFDFDPTKTSQVPMIPTHASFLTHSALVRHH